MLALYTLLLGGLVALSPPVRPSNHPGSVPDSPPALPDRAAEAAVQAVEQNGGQVERDPTRPGGPVVTVRFFGAVTDDALKPVGRLRTVTFVDLRDTGATDGCLKYLTPLKDLQILSIGGTRVTDEGLRDLAPLKS